MKEINVIKRDGTKEPYQIEKIQRQIEYACDGILNVSQSMIELTMNLELYDGIKTSHIDQLAINAAVKLITDPEGDVNYQWVAGRLQNSVLRKEIYRSFTPRHIYEIVLDGVEKGLYTKELVTEYSWEEWELFNSVIDHKKDENLSYAAIRQFIDKYLVRNRSTNEIIETPQIRYMIAAATIMMNENSAVRLARVCDYYKAVSNGEFSMATPLLAGLGTNTKQFSSCVVIKANDSINSIFASGEMMAKYAAKKAGIGFDISRIRPAGSPIRNGDVKHTGLTPFLKKWFADLRSVSQGGIRNASATVNYPIWHYEFDSLIVLKNNKGTEETRVRHLDYCVLTSKYFWNRLKNQENITLFDPNQVPEMYEAFYTDQDKFIELYEEAETNSSLRKKIFPAVEVFNKLLTERTDTGRIYLMFIDNVINQGPVNSKKFPIYQTNLCVEILLPTKSFERLEDEEGRIALCTLASINWSKFNKPEDLRQACRLAVRSLDNILSYQDFLSVQSAKSNEDFRPLGIGVTGLAYFLAKRGLTYGSPAALKEIAKWMEYQSYYLIEQSIELAEERGPCKQWKNTSYAHGTFPIDLRSNDCPLDIELTLDWDTLAEYVTEHGIRNGLLSAIAPVESSSVVIDSTNGIEMPMSLITTKESAGGSLVQIVPEYHRLKDKYQLMWDQPDCVEYLKTAAVLAAFVDQSISTNTFYNPAFFPNGKIPFTLIARNIMLAQKWGLKTLYYSLVNKVGAKAALEEEDCDSCKL